MSHIEVYSMTVITVTPLKPEQCSITNQGLNACVCKNSSDIRVMGTSLNRLQMVLTLNTPSQTTDHR